MNGSLETDSSQTHLRESQAGPETSHDIPSSQWKPDGTNDQEHFQSNGDDEKHQQQQLHHNGILLPPPPDASRREVFRDKVVDHFTYSPVWQFLNKLVLFLVVLDGAIFFFFLMGWQRVCSPRTNCEPRNTIYNVSVHILTGLFTYMATVALPWRCAHAINVMSCNKNNKCSVGRDWYGRPTTSIWFHVPVSHRQGILVMLLLNSIFQYANQVARGVYWSYALQSTMPGSLLVTIFFVLSMACAFVGAVWATFVTERVRKQQPGVFEPGPIKLAWSLLVERKWLLHLRGKTTNVLERACRDAEAAYENGKDAREETTTGRRKGESSDANGEEASVENA
jgi:hypothetical protein